MDLNVSNNHLPNELVQEIDRLIRISAQEKEKGRINKRGLTRTPLYLDNQARWTHDADPEARENRRACLSAACPPPPLAPSSQSAAQSSAVPAAAHSPRLRRSARSTRLSSVRATSPLEPFGGASQLSRASVSARRPEKAL